MSLSLAASLRCQVQPDQRLACPRNAGNEDDGLPTPPTHLVDDFLDTRICGRGYWYSFNYEAGWR